MVSQKKAIEIFNAILEKCPNFPFKLTNYPYIEWDEEELENNILMDAHDMYENDIINDKYAKW